MGLRRWLAATMVLGGVAGGQFAVVWIMSGWSFALT